MAFDPTKIRSGGREISFEPGWFLRDVRRAAKRLGEFMSQVPNCPSCRGTGEARNSLSGDITVYWKGQLVSVCFQCRGAGKV